MPDELKKYSLFAEFDADELRKLDKIAQKSTVNKGEYIFNEGEHGDSLIIVRMGSIRLSKKNKEGVDQDLQIIGSGTWVGEMALFGEKQRTASGVALERSEIYRILYDDLEKLLQQNTAMEAKFYKAIAHGIARRLNYLNSDVATLKKYLAKAVTH
ncbi:MAG: cyclic nucleotide-binding domain-containing protein [Deltaproteobacteria bacterium]|nr:cyclic nucleotide-binding domain-containing protein [Deltaproteobacteria bacterium]